MSLSCMDWAFKQPIAKSSLKFVLVALANYAGAGGECYPSVPTLCFDTGQDDKTVRRNLRELIKQNYIHDTGRRVGRTKQIPVFILDSYATALANPPKNGSLSREGTRKRIERYPKTELEPTRKRVPEPAIDPVKEQRRFSEARKSEEQRDRNVIHIAGVLESLGAIKP